MTNEVTGHEPGEGCGDSVQGGHAKSESPASQESPQGEFLPNRTKRSEQLNTQ